MLTIDPEFQALIPPLSAEERAGLEENIKRDGCLDPLRTWNGILLDGHNRYEICTRLGITFECVPIELADRDEAADWIDRNSLGRRNLTPDQRTMLIARINNRQKKAPHRPAKGAQNAPLIAPKKTAEIIAEQFGVHPSTVKRATAKVALLEQHPDKAQAVIKGDMKIADAVREIKRDKLKEATQIAVKAAPPTICCADALDWLTKQEPVDALITDPPYSTDVPDVRAFAELWLPLALSKVKPTGRAYVCVGAYPEELAAYLAVAMPKQILVWTYRNTLGPSPTHTYKLNWQAILYYQMPDAPRLDCPVMLEQFSVQDISAPDGRLGNRFHAWQKPMELAERLVRHSTTPGGVILDPFCCTGTFLLAASKLGRVAKGCDISKENLKIAIDLGCVYE